jgi:protein-disulfide isomerase
LQEEFSVNRRSIVTGALVLATMLAAIYVLTRGVSPASADRSEPVSTTTLPAAPTSESVPTPSRETAPSSVPAAAGANSVSAASSAPIASVPSPAQTGSGIPDLDPREALGSKNAPIIMEVFSDYQCPACKSLFVGTQRQLMDNYVSTGKVYLVHRDFPLPMHAHSKVAAQYSRAAAQIGKLEPVAEALFNNQEKWEQNGDVDSTVAAVLSAAEMTKIRTMVKSGSVDAAIEKDKALGQTYRVNQTPTTIFHANGQTFPYAGVMSWDILHQFLDQLLAQK